MRCLALAPLILLAFPLALPPDRATPVTPASSRDGLSGSYDVSRAIVIGINDYPGAGIGKLQYAEADANEIADELTKDYGFEEKYVVRLTSKNATFVNIKKEITSLAKTAGKNDRVLIFFAGHGASRSELGFLLPYDADITDDSTYSNTCISSQDIRNWLGLCKAKHVLILADACYSGRLGIRSIGIKSAAGVARLMRLTVREIITAGTKDEVSTEQLGHGIFTAKVLENLRARARSGEAVFTAQDLYSDVLAGVVSSPDSTQEPQLFKEGSGEFLFRAPASTGAGAGAPGEELSSVVTLKFEVVDQKGVPIPNPSITVDDQTVSASRRVMNLDLEDRDTRDVLVAIHATGFQPKFLKVNLRRGQPSPISATLEPSKVPANPRTRMSAKGNVEMVYIPQGAFAMGDGRRSRTMKLDAYWIGRSDVTVGQFRAYCEATGFQYDWAKLKPEWGWQDDHPMVNINWQEAEDYCKWAGGDLPTEAQWEKAARGDDGRTFPWGNDWDLTKLWCSKKDVGDAKSTAPAGSISGGKSPYGCLDMAGNVWQWCLDKVESATESTGAGQYRGLRGGSWSNGTPETFRCTSRISLDPNSRYKVKAGFRLAVRP